MDARSAGPPAADYENMIKASVKFLSFDVLSNSPIYDM